MPRTIIVTQDDGGYWTVAENELSANYLGWDEMLGHFVSLTMPKGGRMYPMLTAEEHAERERQWINPVESECDDWSSIAPPCPFLTPGENHEH